MSRACKGAQQLIQQTAVGVAAAHFNQDDEQSDEESDEENLETIYFYFCFQQPNPQNC